MAKSDDWIEQYLVISALIFLGTAVMLLATREVWNDECSRFFLSTLDFKTILFADVHPPLYPYMLKLLGNPNITLMRILNLTFLLGTGIGILIITPPKNKANIFALTLFLIHPQILNHSVEGSHYALTMFLMTINYYAYLNYPRRRGLHLISGILMAWTHLFSLLLLIPQMFDDKQKGDNDLWLKMSILTAMIMSVPFIGRAMMSNMTNWLQTPSFSIISTSIILFFYGPIGIGLILYMTHKHPKKIDRNATLAYGIPMLILFLVSITIKPIWHDRYLLLFIPFITIQMGQYIAAIKHKRLILGLIAITGISLGLYMISDDYHGFKDAAEQIEDGSSVLHRSTFSYYSLRYYAPTAYHNILYNKQTMTPYWFQHEVVNNTKKCYDYEIVDDKQAPILDTNRIQSIQNFDGLHLIKYRQCQSNNNK